MIPGAFGPTVQSFLKQVENEFIPMYVNNSEVPWEPANSLFSIFFGINEVTNMGALDNDSLYYEDIQSYQNLVNEVMTSRLRRDRPQPNADLILVV